MHSLHFFCSLLSSFIHSMLFTASADKTGAVWDVELQTRLKKLKEHTGIVNSVCPARRGDPLLLSASDDCSTLLWDIRCRKSVGTFSSEYQVFSSVFSDDSSCMFQAGLEGVVRMWDLRKHEVVFELTGHTDAITSMHLSPNGHSLLTHSQDNSVMAWDVRPFMSATAKTRQIGTYYGAKHDFQQNLLGVSWSSDGSRISAGSADGLVYIWDAKSQQVIYRLPGHKGQDSTAVFVSCFCSRSLCSCSCFFFLSWMSFLLICFAF